METNLRKMFVVVGLSFFIVFLSLGRLQLIQGKSLRDNPKNPYKFVLQQGIVRGEIFDKNGLPLAIEGENKLRHYPLGKAASHPVGYYSRQLGDAGVERWFNNELLGQNGILSWKNRWQRLAGMPGAGYNLQLTIDSQLQKLGYRLLGERKGAIIALEPFSGAILALISSPSFDPVHLQTNWDEYLEDDRKLLFNRALSGTYPPGSTFKLVVGAAALEYLPQVENRKFYCPGYIEIEGRRLACYQEHGELSFLDAIALSCNIAFVEIGLELGEERLKAMADKLGFGQPSKGRLPFKTAYIGKGPMSHNALAETSIGQGEVLATPMQMVRIGAVIANEGVLIEPYLLETQWLPGGKPITAKGSLSRNRVMTAPNARILKEGMVATVERGTGGQARLVGTSVAGKTGSAENPHGKTHAWFIGFAPADEPSIVVAVIVENAGTGGGQAGPIAKEIFDYAIHTDTFVFLE